MRSQPDATPTTQPLTPATQPLTPATDPAAPTAAPTAAPEDDPTFLSAFVPALKQGGFALAATVGGGMEWFGRMLQSPLDPTKAAYGKALAPQGAKLRTAAHEEVVEYQKEIEALPNPELFTIGGEVVGARDVLAGVASSIAPSLALAVGAAVATPAPA